MNKSLTFVISCFAVLLCWSCILAVTAFISPPGTAYFVISPLKNPVKVAIEAGGSLEDFGTNTVVTRSSAPDFIHKLYKAGAVLVLDVGVVSGCRSQTVRRKSKLALVRSLQ